MLTSGEVSRRGSRRGDMTADNHRARFGDANSAEATDVTDRQGLALGSHCRSPPGLLDVDGAVDVEGLDVEAPVDSRRSGVVDAAGEAQVVHTFT